MKKGIVFMSIGVAAIIGAVIIFASPLIQAEDYELSYEEDNRQPKEDEKESRETQEPIDNSTGNKVDETDEIDETDDIQEGASDNIVPSLDETSYVDNGGKIIVNNVEDILVLVNKERNLPSDYEPEDLVTPNIRFSFSEDLPKKYMRKEAAKALEELFAKADEDNIELFAASGYRSYNTQKAIFNYRAQRVGEEEANKVSAYPGQSEHQTGLAMDITSRSVDLGLFEKFGETKEGKWLKENAHEFGFIIRYLKGKEDITGYVYEPWHVRYVGEEVAEVISSQEITLEEFFQNE